MAGGFASINGALFIGVCDHHWNVNERRGRPSPIQPNMGGARPLLVISTLRPISPLLLRAHAPLDLRKSMTLPRARRERVCVC